MPARLNFFSIKSGAFTGLVVSSIGSTIGAALFPEQLDESIFCKTLLYFMASSVFFGVLCGGSFSNVIQTRRVPADLLTKLHALSCACFLIWTMAGMWFLIQKGNKLSRISDKLNDPAFSLLGMNTL